MAIYDGRPLWKYRTGMVITEIPVSYFKKDMDMKQYIASQERRPSWHKSINDLLKNFDPEKVEPLYYCKKHRRVEDGSHRFYIALHGHIKTLSARIGNECFKRIRPKTKERIFEEIMRENPKGLSVKDFKWLTACAKSKWPHLSGIDFKGKLFLDVGCNVGYSCLEAMSRGAESATGIDIRPEVIEIANKMKRRRGITDKKMGFLNLDFRTFDNGMFDIVSCMGLLHYFSIKEYLTILTKLALSSRSILILELRILNSPKKGIMTRGIQTLPSLSWLKDHLHHLDFKIIKQIFRGKDRYLIIGKKQSKVKTPEIDSPENEYDL